MLEHWISLTNIPTLGREFSFDDQEMWCTLWTEYNFEAQITTPLIAQMTIIPQPGGFLVRGQLRGTICTVCHRCSEDARVELQHNFDLLETFEDATATDEESHLRGTDTGWELNVASLLWEEFLLAMPEKILCSDTCLGLCPHCGKNKNLDPCDCNSTMSNSPLAQALRNIHIKTN